MSNNHPAVPSTSTITAADLAAFIATVERTRRAALTWLASPDGVAFTTWVVNAAAVLRAHQEPFGPGAVVDVPRR